MRNQNKRQTSGLFVLTLLNKTFSLCIMVIVGTDPGYQWELCKLHISATIQM